MSRRCSQSSRRQTGAAYGAQVSEEDLPVDSQVTGRKSVEQHAERRGAFDPAAVTSSRRARAERRERSRSLFTKLLSEYYVATGACRGRGEGARRPATTPRPKKKKTRPAAGPLTSPERLKLLSVFHTPSRGESAAATAASERKLSVSRFPTVRCTVRGSLSLSACL